MEDVVRYLTADDCGVQNHVVVLPCGTGLSPGATCWTEPELRPYTHFLLNNGNPVDALFHGFVFTATEVRPERSLHPLYATLSAPADKTDWHLWLDTLFRAGFNLSALNACVTEVSDVWIGLPYPHRFQTDFGVVNHQDLDFSDDHDRLTAMRWWISEFTTRWQKQVQDYPHLRLRGFLWPRDAVLPEEDATLVTAVNDRIHAQGLLSLWLPNYGSNFIDRWRELGFDMAAFHANFCGHTDCGYEWINYTSHAARTYQAGMQVTFGKGPTFNDTHHLDYLNLGLDKYNGYMKASFVVYQFPHQTVGDIYRSGMMDYVYLYMFVKGLFTHVHHAGIVY